MKVEIKNSKLPKNCFCSDCTHNSYCRSIFTNEDFSNKEDGECLFSPSPFKAEPRLRSNCVYFYREVFQGGHACCCHLKDIYGIENCVGCTSYISNKDPRYIEGMKEVIEKIRREERYEEVYITIDGKEYHFEFEESEENE